MRNVLCYNRFMAGKNTNKYAIDPMSGALPSRGTGLRPRLQPAPRRPPESFKTPVKTPPPQVKKARKAVSFELRIPELNPPKLPYKRLALVLAAIAGAILIIVGLFIGAKNLSKSQPVGVHEIEQRQAEPTFETLAPPVSQKTEKAVAFDEEKKVASFNDKIGETGVTVSQQPLPDNFKSNAAEETEKLARSFKATRVITANDIRAYTGLSSETGTQTVVFTKNGLLIFIHASQELNNDALARYIIDLK